MPNADKFNALGQGNGFSFTPDKVDVSSSNWCTLSGLTEGPASDESKNESLKAAMQLYWNSNFLQGSSTIAVEDSVDGTVTRVALGTVTDTNVVEKQPKERVCTSTIGAGKFGLGVPGISGVTSKIEFAFKIIRMYDGSVSDEDNFVGYGIQSISASSPSDPTVSFNGIGTSATTNLASFGATIDLVSFTSQSSLTSDTITQDVGVCTIPTPTGVNVKFLCVARAKSNGPNGTFGIPPEIDTIDFTRSANASTMFASVAGKETTAQFDGYDDEGEEIYETFTTSINANASLTAVDFYRY